MSRTTRRTLTPLLRPVPYRRTIGRPEPPRTFVKTCPDGKAKLDIAVVAARASRVAGMREHKSHRRRARMQLRTDPDIVPAGKMRRYGDAYGYCML